MSLAMSLVAACARPAPPPAARAAAAAERARAPVRYYFNRNAFVSSVRTGSGALVALTDSGNLLVFDPVTFAVVAERVPRSPVTCLGAVGPQDVMVGLDDGRIFEVEIPSLKMKRVGVVDGRPAWIGRGPSGLLVVHGLVAEKPFGWRDRGFAALALDELQTGRSIRLPFTAQSFLLDSRGRLWIGADHGEWGGDLAVLDLGSWSLREVDGVPHGVYGLTETTDGRILAYGGTMHMGMTASFVAAVAANQKALTKLFELPYAQKGKPAGPTLPISHVVSLREGRAWLVFAYDQVFEVDARFTRWRKLPPFEAHYSWGRPDAVGAYPAARVIHLLGESPRRLAIATALDGWIELREGGFVEHRLAGEIGSSNVDSFRDWTGRIVADAEGHSWVLDGDAWRDIEAPPPVKLPETARRKHSAQSAFLPRTDGKLVALFRDEDAGTWSEPPPERLLVTALCEGQRCEVLGQETGTLTPNKAFVTPDNLLWALDDRGLWTFSAGRWTQSLLWHDGPATSPQPRMDQVLAVVSTPRVPWLLQGEEGLALMWPRAPGSPPKLVSAEGWQFVGRGRDGIDVAACAGRVFAAGSAGVCELNLVTARCAPFPVGGATSVRKLGCDRAGKLWLAGYGVWKLEGDRAIAVPDLDGLTAGREIQALGRDTGAGLPIAIEDRGVVVLSASSGATPARSRETDEGDAVRAAPDRQAVFVSVDVKDDRALMKELQDTLWEKKTGVFAGYAGGFDDPTRWLFYGRDASRMVDVIRAVLQRSGYPARLIRRDGARGAPEQRIEIPKGRAPAH